MAEKAAAESMQMQGHIFNEMVMQEAIKDKTLEVQKQMIDDEGNVLGHQQQEEFKEEKSEDSDSDFNSDGDENVLKAMREERISKLKQQRQELEENIAKGHGQYTEIVEDEFLPSVTKTKFCVVHFYHQDFERCKIVDHHLKQIAPKHMECKFMTMNAEKCPFFIAKLQIQVLPTIVCFMDGIACDRIVGFEELGGKDEFPTLLLARRLVNAGVCKALNAAEKGQMKLNRKGRGERDASDDDY